MQIPRVRADDGEERGVVVVDVADCAAGGVGEVVCRREDYSWREIFEEGVKG